jgi:ribosomal-protein-alanine N-acetyltransferase
MDFPILETERLLLREWDVTDAEDLFAFYSIEDVVRYTPITAYTTLEQAATKAADFRDWFRVKQLSVVWAVVLKETGKIVGECSLHSFSPKDQRAEVGYAYSPQVWGKGIGSESIRKIVDYAFTDFSLFPINRLEAYTDPRNVASAKILEKLGFIKEGRLRQRHIEKGEAVDSVVYGLLRDEYF